MTLSDEDRAIYTTRLIAAEDALHQLEIGQARVMVRADSGEQVQYTPADTARLRGYVRELRQRLGQTAAGPITLQPF